MTAVTHKYIVGGMLLQYSTTLLYAKLFITITGITVLGRNSGCVFPLEHYLSNDPPSDAEQKNFFGYKEINISKQNVKEFSTYSEA